MKFTFAELSEKAEGYRNFKKYVKEYFDGLRESEPTAKFETHYQFIASEFYISERYVRMIVRNEK